MWQTSFLRGGGRRIAVRECCQALGACVLYNLYTLAARLPMEALLTRLVALRVNPGSCGWFSHSQIVCV